MMTTERDSLEHARQCAMGTLESIREGMAAIDLANGSDDGEAEYDGEMMDAEAIGDRLREMPLELTIRGYRTRDGAWEADRYELLMSTGGPAVRIVGSIGQFDEPGGAWLECQDWFTPWTPVDIDGDDRKALLAFACLFYMGD